MTNPYQPPSTDSIGAELGASEGEPGRHGCVTAWLIVTLVSNGVVALINVAGSDAIRQAVPGMPIWGLAVLTVACLVNVACAIALLKWRKWGFYGFVVTSVIAAAVNFSAGIPITQVAFGLVGIAILFAILQLGQPPAWKRLR